MAKKERKGRRRVGTGRSGPSEPVTVRMYNVGFGDCFLLTFPYQDEGGDRHVLIDFGSTGLPGGSPKDRLVRIAKDIETRSGGHLTAVVVTHRHQDHIGGFATTQSGDGPGDIIASLRPELVVQPWTEHPDAAPDATAPPSTRERIRTQIEGLHASQDFASHLSSVVPSLLEAADGHEDLAREIGFLGEENIKNESAVRNLVEMAAKRQGVYVHCGGKSGLEDLLPGVKVSVLGPPTLEQTDSIRRQRTRDASEYWHLQEGIFRSLADSVRGNQSLGPLLARASARSKSEVPPDAVGSSTGSIS